MNLNLNKDPKDCTVVVAMSGGVDSSVTAALLAEAGYRVIGLTMQLYDQGETAVRGRTCCAGQDLYDARRIAAELGFPHYVLNYESRFGETVIDDFVNTYVAGETPIPCVRCNQKVKFVDLLKTSRSLGADALATGHYVRRVQGKEKAELHRGLDRQKDQSYFLFTTEQDQLDFLRFPLGGMKKEATRTEAGRLGLPVAKKPDSQDICFVPDGDYAGLVTRRNPAASKQGDIVDLNGQKVGKHEGIIHFTVGQRRGLEIGGQEEPLYVVRLDATQNRVVVGPRAALARSRVHLKEVNWLANEAEARNGTECQVKLRSLMEPVAANFVLGDDGRACVDLKEPVEAVAPGQALVAYAGERVLGGGWIVAGEITG